VAGRQSRNSPLTHEETTTNAQPLSNRAAAMPRADGEPEVRPIAVPSWSPARPRSRRSQPQSRAATDKLLAAKVKLHHKLIEEIQPRRWKNCRAT
jgi:hypothetical protein